MTEREALKLIAVMTAALPREWSFLTPDQRKDTTGIYTRMLADLPYAAANAAVESLLATATRMPTIAEVRESTLRALHGSVRAGGDAWGDVRKLAAYRNVGDISGVDALVLRACERMGWIRQRTLLRGGAEIQQWHVETGEHEPSDRAQFIALYDKLASEERREQNVYQLPAAQRFRALQAANEQQQLSGATADGPRRVDFARLLPEGKAQ